MLDVGVVLVQRAGAGAPFFEVFLLVGGLLLDVAAAFERPHPLSAHDAHQGSQDGVGEEAAFFEGEDGVEQAFHGVDGCISGLARGGS